MGIDIKLETFKGTLKDVARSNRFCVTVTGHQGDASWTDNMSFFVKGFPLPARTIGDVTLNYQGMQSKLAGDSTFDDVTMVLHNDYEFVAKSYIEKWMESIASVGTEGTNLRAEPIEYKANIIVEQLGRNGETIAKYMIVGAYPKQMDQIDLNHENQDSPEEISVTFSVDYWYRMDTKEN